MVRRTSVLALLVMLTVGLAACGPSAKDSATSFQGDQRAVAQTVENLQTASRKGQGDKICSTLLTPALVARIEKASRDHCDSAINGALDDVDTYEMQVRRVVIRGDRASVVVLSDAPGDHDRVDTLTLQRIRRSWRVAALG